MADALLNGVPVFFRHALDEFGVAVLANKIAI
jgi:hypothetical protein